MAKTIIQNSTRLSKYVFEDDVTITFKDGQIITPDFIIGDLNDTNATLVENVTAPADWYGNKYKYEAASDTWTVDSQFVDPRAAAE